jgi:hypothetical protein
MNLFDEMPTSGVAADWMIFVAILLAVGIGVACFVIWLLVFRKGAKKRKRLRRHRGHRNHNPTLAETGGLPPMRPPNQPPRGA